MKFAFTLLFALTLSAHSFSAQAGEGFHNLPLGDYYGKISDWDARQVGASTLSVYLTTEGPKTAGYYDEASFGNVTRTDMGYKNFAATNKELWDEYSYAPRSLSVYLNGGHSPTYNAVYFRSTNPFEAFHNMTDERFHLRYQEWVVQKGYRVQDHVVFSGGGERKHAVIFVKDGRAYSFNHGMDAQTFAAEVTRLGNEGWAPEQINVGELPFNTYSAVWIRPTESSTVYYYDMPADEYQRRFAELGAQGYRVKFVQGYHNSTKFAAIWVK